MGLGLWHHATPQALQSQADLHALSRFPEKPRDRSARSRANFAERPGFGRVRCIRKSNALGARISKQNDGRVAARAEAESPWEKSVNVIQGSVVAGSSFWQPFWSNIGARTLELTGGGGHSGGGSSGDDGGGSSGDGGDGSSGDGGDGSSGDGGDGSSGDGGDGSSGGSDPSSHELQIRSAVANQDSKDEDQTSATRTPSLASLSTTAAAVNASADSQRAKENEATQPIHQKDSLDDAFAKRSETSALKRLQREAFADLMRVRERLDKLEFHTGLRKSKTQAPPEAKTRLKGEVCAGAALLLLDDQCSRASRAAVEQSGLHTGMDVRFTFETPYRDADLMVTECSAGRDGSVLGGPLAVTKVVYNAQVTQDLNVVVAPVGARAGDVTETVNPLQGQALTEFARAGPAMYQHCAGSALGATLRGKSTLVSLSQYLSGWGASGPPLCLTTLAHAMFQPWESSVFSLSAVNRFWPSPPLPSFRGLHWSELGPLVMSKTRCSSPRESSDVQAPSGMSNDASWGTPSPHGNAIQSVAVAGEIDVGANVSLAGWAQTDRGYWLDEAEKREIEWGVSLTKTVGTTVDWGLCVGSSKVDLWSDASNEANVFLGPGDCSGEPCDMQLHMEAFMKLSMGRGFTLQPGLVYLLNRQSQTPAFMLRSSWAL